MSIECYYPSIILEGLIDVRRLSVMCSSELESNILPQQISFGYYLLVLIITMLLESPVYFYYQYKKNNKYHIFDLFKNFLLIVVVLNLATHPIVIWLFPYLGESFLWSILNYVAFAEIFAILIEALILKYYFHFSFKDSWTASFLANMVSWTLGVWAQTKGWF